jgi:hypothetical protein
MIRLPVIRSQALLFGKIPQLAKAARTFKALRKVRAELHFGADFASGTTDKLCNRNSFHNVCDTNMQSAALAGEPG